MNISFEGFDNKVITFAVSGTVEPGNPVKLVSSGTVAAAEEGEKFIGIAASCRDGIAGVILSGAVEVLCSDVSAACGYNKLVSAGGKEVRTDEDGIDMIMLEMDYDSGTAVILL